MKHITCFNHKCLDHTHNLIVKLRIISFCDKNDLVKKKIFVLKNLLKLSVKCFKKNAICLFLEVRFTQCIHVLFLN